MTKGPHILSTSVMVKLLNKISFVLIGIYIFGLI